jgi:threonine/homoserine/homoserine lactone efflux protein
LRSKKAGDMNNLIGPLASLPGLDFWLGYTALICVPGPNMMLAGASAAAVGFRRAVPLITALACGAASLAAALHLIIGAALHDQVQVWLSPLSGALMLLVGLRTFGLQWVCMHARQEPGRVVKADLAVAFACGATNPATAMFFTAYFLARSFEPDPLSCGLIFGGTVLCCLAVLSAATALLSTRKVRSLVERNFAAIKVSCATVFLVIGVVALWSGLHRIAAHV